MEVSESEACAGLYQMVSDAGFVLKRTVSQHRCGYQHELVLERVAIDANL
jgi:hypothetical protein